MPRNRRGAFDVIGIDPVEDVSPADGFSTVPSTASGGGRRRSSAYNVIGLDTAEDGAPIAPLTEPETPGVLETMTTLVNPPIGNEFAEGVGQFTDAVVPDPMQRGFYRARQASEIGNADASDPYGVADTLIETSQQIAEYPMDDDTSSALTTITDPNSSWSDIFGTIVTYPGLKALGAVTGESLVQYAPSLGIAAGTTAATGNPVAGAVAAAPVTFGVTFNTILLDEMRKKGANPDDPANREVIAELLQDKEFWKDARKSAAAYAIPITIFDTLTLGLAGNLLAPAIRSGSKAKVGGALVGELGLQAGGGVAGEFTGQGGQIAVGSREAFNKGEIALEGLAELPIGAIETAIQAPAALKQQKAVRDRSAAFEAIGLSADALNLEVPSETISVSQTPVQNVSFDPTPAAPEVQAAPAAETPVLPDPVEQPQNETPPADRTFVNRGEEINAQPVGDVREVATVNNSQRLNVRPVIIDINDLRQAEGDLQPRDRSLKESQIGAAARARDLDPQQLGDSPVGDSGAPIVLKDGTILSGNGRVLTLQQVLRDPTLADQKAKYNDFLREYQSTVDPDRAFDPVLVMQVQDDIDSDTAIRFAQDNNISRVAQMSATEQAQLDADRISDDMIRLYTGGEIESRENRQFLDAFIRDLVAENERNSFSRDGRLTKEGAQRIEAAILARAYKDKGVLSNILESRDDNIRNLTTAMLSASPRFAQMQGEIAAGRIEAEYDITPAVVEVAQTISRLRKEGVKVQDYLNQQDAFSDRDPVVDALIAAFYDGNRALSAQKLAAVLDEYVNEASKKETGGFFEDETTAEDVVQLARQKVDRGERGADSGQISFIEESKGRDAARPSQSRQEAQRPTDASRVPSIERRRGQATESQTQLDTKVVPATKRDEIIDARTRDRKQVEEIDNSVLASVFIAAGFDDPNAVMLLPPKRQIKIVTDTFEQRFGIKVIVKNNVNPKNALNRLMEGYIAFEDMAAALKIPAKGLGLGGNLRYYIDGQNPAPGALAYYSNSEKVIAQSVTSNSFAHEWFHALDYWMMESFGDYNFAEAIMGDPENVRGQSAVTRKARKSKKPFKDAAPEQLKDAFIRVMRTLYVDGAQEAAKIKQLEKEISRLEAKQRETGKQYKSLETAKQRLKNVMEGRSSARIGGTKLNENTKGNDYFNRPTEMFARAGEAFVARRVEVMRGENALVTPGDGWYDSWADDFVRDAMEQNYIDQIYPQMGERMEIFGAYQDLVDAMEGLALFGEKDWSDSGTGVFIADPMGAWKVTPDRVKGGVFDKTLKDINREKRQKENALDRQRRTLPKVQDKKSFGLKVWEAYDKFTNITMLATKDGNIMSIAGRYPGNEMMNDIRRLTSYNPGGSDGTVTGGTVYDKTQQKMAEYTARLSQIVQTYELDSLSVAEADILRDFLIGQEDTIDLAINIKGTDYNLAQPARELRQLLDMIYSYSRKAQVNVGYLTEGGYLPRIINDEAIFSNQAEFMDDASKVYDLIWENEVGEYNGSPEQMDQVLKRVDRNIRQLFDEDTQNDFDSAKRQMKDNGAVDGVTAARLFEAIKAAEVEAKANAYTTAILMAQVGDPNTGTVSADFTKERKLPPEADKILQRWYVDDPILAIQTYILGATRKAEFTRAFGLHKIPKGKGKPEYNDYLDYALEKLIREDGVDPNDAQAFISSVRGAVGQNQFAKGKTNWQSVASDWAASAISIPLLKAAAISSIAEPFTTALQTGRMSDGFKSFGLTVQQAWTGSKWLGDQDKFHTLDQVSRIIGAAQDFQFSDTITNRLGSGYLSNSKANQLVTKFFIGNFLGPLTNAQRRAQVQIFTKFFYEIASDFKNFEGSDKPAHQKALRRHERMLQDFGISSEDLPAFVDYVISISDQDGKFQMPTVESLTNERGELSDMAGVYANAVSRAARMAVQDPSPGNRSLIAEHPLGRLIFSITSFIFAFQRNVIIKTAKGIARDAADNGKLSAAEYAFMRVGLPALILLVMHGAVSTMREMVLNEERLEQRKKDGDYNSHLFWTALSRAGFYGAFDPIVNAMYGLKYQRDFSSAIVGAGNYYLSAMEDVVNSVIHGNPNSKYDEYKMYQGLFDLLVNPALTFGFAMTPNYMQKLLYPSLVLGTSSDAKKGLSQFMLETFHGGRYVPREQKNTRGRRRRQTRRRRDGR